MKPEVAHSRATVTVRVTEEMTAVLDGRLIHPVYSTYWLAYHSEVAARRAIESFFDPGENAVGGELYLKHLAMAAVGDQVTITATVTEVRLPVIKCRIEAVSRSRKIAEGFQTQIVLPQDRIDQLLREAQHLAAHPPAGVPKVSE